MNDRQRVLISALQNQINIKRQEIIFLQEELQRIMDDDDEK